MLSTNTLEKQQHHSPTMDKTKYAILRELTDQERADINADQSVPQGTPTWRLDRCPPLQYREANKQQQRGKQQKQKQEQEQIQSQDRNKYKNKNNKYKDKPRKKETTEGKSMSPGKNHHETKHKNKDKNLCTSNNKS